MMSDHYTPTNEEVRDAFICGIHPESEKWAAEYDRWLAKHDADLVQSIVEMLLAKANLAATNPDRVKKPSEVGLIANMIGDETAAYLRWVALLIKDTYETRP